MENSTKTDIDIIQELLSIYAARKEACEKILSQVTEEAFRKKLEACNEQTDQFIKDLLDELSLHGDAVSAEVDRNNEYQKLWKQVSPDFETMNAAAASQNFNLLEQRLQEYYQEVTLAKTEMPETLDELIQKQQSELKATT